MAEPKPKTIIGRAEKIELPELGLTAVPARIDTGARTSSMWVSEAVVKDGVLQVVFFGQGNPLYSGQVLAFTAFEEVMVASSTGHIQRRYKVRLLVRLHSRKVRSWFTLADRSTQVYPVLIGRNFLRGKFVVDVKEGTPLLEAEQRRAAELKGLLETDTQE